MYWDYYKNGGNMYQEQGNEQDFGGYSEQELYVDRKFDNYKEEILYHLHARTYKECLINKVDEYMGSNKVKRMSAKAENKYFHYGIIKGAPITKDHIMSLILYTDFSDYCTKFSGTFRTLLRTEKMQDVKARNAEFWFQSKYLREAIEIYGWGSGFRSKDGELGPFYTGVDNVLCLPRFALRLCSPTSTSKNIAISITFATKQGMIMSLNNTGHSLAHLLSFQDVSWLSRFPEEDERVFNGGKYMIRVESVCIVDTNQNFEVIFHALFYFDAMISDGHFSRDFVIKSKDTTIINKLLKDSSQFDPYIHSMFRSYIRNKIRININMKGLSRLTQKQSGVIIKGNVKAMSTDYAHNYLDFDEDDFYDNLIKKAIFRYLPYARIITINTSTENNRSSYPFDPIKFLEKIHDCKTWKLIKIKQRMSNEPKRLSWLSFCWDDDIKSEYQKKHLMVEHKTEKIKLGGIAYIDEYIIIRKGGNQTHKKQARRRTKNIQNIGNAKRPIQQGAPRDYPFKSRRKYHSSKLVENAGITDGVGNLLSGNAEGVIGILDIKYCGSCKCYFCICVLLLFMIVFIVLIIWSL